MMEHLHWRRLSFGVGSVALLAALSLAGTIPAGAQERTVALTLSDALSRTAETAGPRAARMRADGATLKADAARGRALPMVGARFEGINTDDPVAAFGTRLRQGRFTQADFAIPSLNDPDRISDLSLGIEARWEIWSAATGSGVNSARAGAEAASAMHLRTVEAAQLGTRLGYLGILQASAVEEAAEAALASARETLTVVLRRTEAGVATDAARLRAQAAVAAREADLARAQAGSAAASERLAAHLGLESGLRIDPTTPMAAVLSALESSAGDVEPPTERADIRATRAMSRARASQGEALGATGLPSVEAFSGTAVHRGGGETGHYWTAGVRVSLPLLTGWTAGRAAEAVWAESRALDVEADQRLREAVAELRALRAEIEAGRRAAAASRAGLEAASEAERLTRLRYEEGMATLSDLLAAQSESRAARTGTVAADAALGMALAQLHFTAGDPAITNASSSGGSAAGGTGPENDR